MQTFWYKKCKHFGVKNAKFFVLKISPLKITNITNRPHGPYPDPNNSVPVLVAAVVKLVGQIHPSFYHKHNFEHHNNRGLGYFELDASILRPSRYTTDRLIYP